MAGRSTFALITMSDDFFRPRRIAFTLGAIEYDLLINFYPNEEVLRPKSLFAENVAFDFNEPVVWTLEVHVSLEHQNKNLISDTCDRKYLGYQ